MKKFLFALVLCIVSTVVFTSCGSPDEIKYYETNERYELVQLDMKNGLHGELNMRGGRRGLFRGGFVGRGKIDDVTYYEMFRKSSDGYIEYFKLNAENGSYSSCSGGGCTGGSCGSDCGSSTTRNVYIHILNDTTVTPYITANKKYKYLKHIPSGNEWTTLESETYNIYVWEGTVVNSYDLDLSSYDKR